MKTNESVKKLPVFADRFRELRGEMTQDKFAEFVGISRPTVGFYENGERIPDALILKMIASKCQVSSDWLLGLSDVKTENGNIKSISQKTGLSENAIDLLIWAKLEKDVMKKHDVKIKYYASDIFNMLLENLDYFSDLIHNLIKIVNLNVDLADDDYSIEDELITANISVGNKILKNGVVLYGDSYKRYLYHEAKEDFYQLVEFISSQTNPNSYEKDTFDLMKKFLSMKKYSDSLKTEYCEDRERKGDADGQHPKAGE